ncbi:DnaJ C-terminal domain-containing protein [Roseivivax sp. CAU 1753]
MSDDPYKVLGLTKSATQDEIKKAYRKLAKKLHPDLHPGDESKQAEFQAVSAANSLLSDPEQRKRFDAGEIDASGQERAERQFYHQYAGQDAGRRYDQGGPSGGFEDASDLFSELFGRGRQGARGGGFQQTMHARGPDSRYQLEVDFLEAAAGASRSVTLPDGNRLEIKIPAGLKDGQTLRLRGKGGAGFGNGPAGDALVTIAVRPHPVFMREGNDIEVELPVTFDEAVLGAKVEVPTISGSVSMTIPKGASSGHRLRLKGKGIAPAKGAVGDQYVRLRIVLPDRIDARMEELATQWREHAQFDPRKQLRRKT